MNPHYFIIKKKKKTKTCPTDITDSVCQKVKDLTNLIVC